VNFHTAIFLFIASAVAGALNSVAGGGSFISFPALLFTGVPPISANATNTVALWIASVASLGSYRKRLLVSRRVIIPLAASSFIGGVAGAYLLLHTPAQTFLRLLPWLMLGATLLFVFGRHLTRVIRVSIEVEPSTVALIGATFFVLLVAVYGGYFGGGIGILTLAMLAALGMTDIHAMNALKIVLTGIINGVAAIAFVVAGAVVWREAGLMIVGGTIGGFLGAHYAQKLPAIWVRALVIAVGIAMTVYFFWRGYH
jgi:uncharacterized membrane protein YfcA